MTASLIEWNHMGAKIMFSLMTCQMMDLFGYLLYYEKFQRKEKKEGRAVCVISQLSLTKRPPRVLVVGQR